MNQEGRTNKKKKKIPKIFYRKFFDEKNKQNILLENVFVNSGICVVFVMKSPSIYRIFNIQIK